MKHVKYLFVFICAVLFLNVTPAIAKRAIYGKVTSSKGGPIAGATVTAYDSDPGGDQKMGSVRTDNNGNYKITYRGGSWDGKKTSHHTSWRPDIYIVVIAPDHKQKKSKEYNNHKLKDDLKINVTLQYMGGARTVTGKIVNSSNKPVAGALVTACDADPFKDQNMGSVRTDNNGNYKITYRGGSWDGKKTSQHTQWRPDIYVVVTENNYKKYKSRVYTDHKLQDQLTVNAKLENKPGKTFPSNKDMCSYKKSDAQRCKEKGPKYIWLGPEGRLGKCTPLRKEVKSLENTYKATTPHVLAYLTYFETVVGSGAAQRSLPNDVKIKLTNYFGNVVNKIKYASSKHTSNENTAMTDCYDIYFPAGSGVVMELKNGRIFNANNRGKLHWLLHEMTHAKQCSSWGGRYIYADKWFGQLKGTFIEQIILRKSISEKAIHDAMPMEVKAEQNADAVMKKLGY